MKTNAAAVWLALLLLVGCLAFCPSRAAERIDLHVDTSQAEAVLAVAKHLRAGEAVTEAEWQRVFTTEPYKRLKRRETSMHRPFDDETFKAFVARDVAGREPQLTATLRARKRADLHEAAARALAYLPAQAVLHATIYPVVKPQTNSFVFETEPIRQSSCISIRTSARRSSRIRSRTSSTTSASEA